MNKVIFLDRDGTLNVDTGYLHEKEKLVFADGVLEGLKILQNKNYKLIIITNQSGISKGYYSEEQFLDFQEYFCDILRKNDIYIEKTYYCPHSDLDNCECRKPKLKLFYDAINEFDIDIKNSYVIGDKMRDLSLCEKEDIKGFLISSENIIVHKNITIAKNFLDATNKIIEII